MKYDKIIIGAGLYGLYSAIFCAKKGEKVVVFERDSQPFMRATYINQARVHMGYHYPRSISTALKSKGYFDRFNKDFAYCIHDSFDKIYATSADFSFTNAECFEKFCNDGDIPCEPVSVSSYFKNGLCDGAFKTVEYTYDAHLLRDELLSEVEKYKDNIDILCDTEVVSMEINASEYIVKTDKGGEYSSEFVLNSTYASVNQLQSLAGFEPFKIKYELCEIILCKVGDKLRDVGITVMDGPFFSIMPFGKTGLHSLTSVTFTPHIASFDNLPTFPCQEKSGGYCSPLSLGNCNDCPAKPKSAYPYMGSLARKYLKDEFDFEYHSSLFSIKPILKASEIDDSRPTVIRKFSEKPTFVSVLSGKINTVYDLDEVLSE